MATVVAVGGCGGVAIVEEEAVGVMLIVVVVDGLGGAAVTWQGIGW